MALEGTLADMSLGDLFQIFQMGEKSGILSLIRDADQGQLYVHTGRLVDAALIVGDRRQPPLTGEAAALQMLQWPEASFCFTHDPAVARRPVTIQHPSTWLLLEAVRQQRSAQASSQIITLQTSVEPGATANSTEIGMGLDLDQWRILDRVVGRTCLDRLSQETHIAPHTIIQLVMELVATGLLQVTVPDVRVPAMVRTRARRGTGTLEQLSPAPKAITRLGSTLLQAIQRRVRAL